MTPREKVTDTEKIAWDKIDANWDNFLRTTPKAIEEFENKYPRICEIVSQKVKGEGVEDLTNVFRPEYLIFWHSMTMENMFLLKSKEAVMD